MFLRQFLLHPAIKHHFKDYKASDYLFRQGESATTMFLIIEGIVQLFDENEEGNHLVGTFGAGQFFGEKAMVTVPLRRFFSAQAQTNTTVMEFQRADIPSIERVIPGFSFVLFQSAVHRLDRAYYLIRVLRSSDPLEKLVHCILYFYRCPGVEGAAAKYLPLTVDDVHYLVNMEKPLVAKCLDELAKRNILVKRPNECYLLRDEKALLSVVPELEAIFQAA